MLQISGDGRYFLTRGVILTSNDIDRIFQIKRLKNHILLELSVITAHGLINYTDRGFRPEY